MTALDRLEQGDPVADAPAAVLLVDVRTGQVVFANPRARQLGRDLPPPVARCVERLAAGKALDGELVELAGGDDGRDRPYEAHGILLSDLPGLESAALLVLLDAGTRPPRGEGLRALRERAVVATDISFTITDSSLPDDPLIWVNPAFSRTTGYSFEQAVGRNCRFLQGPGTDPAAVEQIREALRERRPCTATLLNYRADGTAFWNELSLSPVLDDDGLLTHFVGVQADVTARVSMEREREAAYAAERAARADAEAAQARLALLAEATTLLTATLDVDVAMDRLAGLAVPLLADWCVVDLVEDSGEAHRVAVAHVDPGGADIVRRIDEIRARHRNPSSMVARVIASGEPLLVPDVTDDDIGNTGYDVEQLALFRELESRSAMVVPLRARRQNLGTLTLVSTSASERRFGQSDFELAKDLARRAALAVDNARLYTREHRVAEALQRSLLPVLPEVPWLSLAAHYLPSAVGAQVGGDWYDVLVLPDGVVGLAVGDVMGHDLSAAAAMGQLRSVLRSYAWEGDAASEVLDRLDRLVQGLEMAQLATAVYARLEPAVDGSPVLRYANAGHLPPLLRSPDGSARFLEDGRSVLLGAWTEGSRAEGAEVVEPGSTLLLYTDGLVERRDASIDEGLEWLRREVLAVDRDADPATYCDAIVGALDTATLADDVALLIVRVEG